MPGEEEADESGRSGRAQRSIGRASGAIEFVALIIFVVMIFVTLLQIATRFVFHIPMPWTEELARTLFLVAIMGGIAVAAWRQEHIQVDYLHQFLSRRALRALYLAFDVAIVGFLLVWLQGALRLSVLSGPSSYVTLPWFRISYLYWIEAGAIVLTILFVISRALIRMRRLPGRSE